MLTTLVTLGGFLFVDHSTPAKISIGGKQAHKVHDTIGSMRVVDAMGPTPGDKTWTGRFRGGGAIDRAMSVDAMRIAGAPVELMWFGLLYLVLITEFTADTEKINEVPYSITCVVVDDPQQDAATGQGASMDSLVGSDLSSASSIADGGAPGDVTGAIAGIGTAVAAIPQLQGATASVLAPVALATQTAVSAISGDMATADPALDAVSPDGSDPSIIASWLNDTASAMTTQSCLADTYGYVARIGVNVALGAT